MATYRKIKLSNTEKFVLVDAEDFDFLDQWKWQLTRRYVSRTVYLGRKNGKSVKTRMLMHRYLIGASKNDEVDHINGNPLDNRKKNLRLCSHRENARNQNNLPVSRSGYRGVYGKENSWRVIINIDGSNRAFGSYKTALEAAYIHDQIVKQVNGNFALLNKGILS